MSHFNEISGAHLLRLPGAGASKQWLKGAGTLIFFYMGASIPKSPYKHCRARSFFQYWYIVLQYRYINKHSVSYNVYKLQNKASALWALYYYFLPKSSKGAFLIIQKKTRGRKKHEIQTGFPLCK